MKDHWIKANQKKSTTIRAGSRWQLSLIPFHDFATKKRKGGGLYCSVKGETTKQRFANTIFMKFLGNKRLHFVIHEARKAGYIQIGVHCAMYISPCAKTLGALSPPCPLICFPKAAGRERLHQCNVRSIERPQEMKYAVLFYPMMNDE